MFPEISSIRIRRQRLGLKQNELAKLAQVSQSLIAKLEKGKLEPSYSIAIKIFKTLDSQEHKDEKKCSDIMTARVILIKSSEKVNKASEIMKKNSIDQLPITDGKNIIGSISESLIFSKIMDQGKNKILSKRISEIMGEPFPILNYDTPLSLALPILKTEPAILISKNRKIVGIITKANLI